MNVSKASDTDSVKNKRPEKKKKLNERKANSYKTLMQLTLNIIFKTQNACKCTIKYHKS